MSRKAIFVTAGVTRGICTVRLPGYAPVVAVAVGVAPGETWNGASAQMVAYSAPAGATPDRVLVEKVTTSLAMIVPSVGTKLLRISWSYLHQLIYAFDMRGPIRGLFASILLQYLVRKKEY